MLMKKVVFHTADSIIGDGTCLFDSSHLMYGPQIMTREVLEVIVRYVVDNWADLSVMSRQGVYCQHVLTLLIVI